VVLSIQCRLTAYKGKSVLLGDLIVKPKNSLVCQSRDAWFHPGVEDQFHVRNIRVNGDGFGCAFYGNNPEEGSCVIKFVTPAWSNKNLINLGNYVYSNLILAHVRAATNGKDPFEQCAVSIENCHPFKYGRWTFMHNGGIPRFHKVKRAILNALVDEVFQGLTGSTDSEHIFALFLNCLPDRNAASTLEETTLALERTITKILDVCKQCGVPEPCSLNFVVTDGVNLFATRYRNSVDPPPSLYYNYGKDFNCETGCFEIHEKSQACEIVVSSAPLAKCCTSDGKCGNWTLMPENTMLVCVGDECDMARISKIYLKPIDIPPLADLSPSDVSSGFKSLKSQPSLVFDNSRLDLPSCAQSCSVPPSSQKENNVGNNGGFSIGQPQSQQPEYCDSRGRVRSTSSTAADAVVGLPLEPPTPGPVLTGSNNISTGITGFGQIRNAPTWSEDMFVRVPYAGEQIPSSAEKSSRVLSPASVPVSARGTSSSISECAGANAEYTIGSPESSGRQHDVTSRVDSSNTVSRISCTLSDITENSADSSCGITIGSTDSQVGSLADSTGSGYNSSGEVAKPATFCPASKLTSELTLCFSKFKKDCANPQAKASCGNGSSNSNSKNSNNNGSGSSGACTKTGIMQTAAASKFPMIASLSSQLVAFPVLISLCVLVVGIFLRS
jgi:glutamine amidotransferase